MSARSAVYHFEKSLFTPAAARRLPSLAWDMGGVMLFGGFGLACFATLSWLITTNYVQEHIYHFNVGQSIVEGIALHGTLFLIVGATLLGWNRRRNLAITSGCLALFLAAFSFDMLYWEPYRLKVEYYTIKTAKIKKPLRIVFVSDIQTDRIGSHEMNTLKMIQAQNADLIILGGDYIQTFADTREKHLPEKFRQMLLDDPLEAPLGVYAVAGNIGGHAGVSDAELFKDTSVEYDHRTRIFHGKDEGWDPPIDLVLLSAAHSRNGFVGYSSRRFAEQDLMNSGNFIVMAGHYPNYAIDGYANPNTGNPSVGYRNAEKAPDLMLAGHTHGGQIVFPSYGPVWREDETLKQVPLNMWRGFHPYPNGGHLLVTRGSGLERGWAPRIRLFCRAEISVIDIVPESP
ncbi:MAG: metallophosphoesterase [Planctomycetaceae bacterium]|nr:metallophosphoesterase [Planctomycetaceae bacterium]